MTNPDSKADAVEALAGLYHSWITGLVLTILNRRDANLAEEFVFQLFRRPVYQSRGPAGVGSECLASRTPGQGVSQLFDGVHPQRAAGAHEAVSASWIALWEGLLSAHNRFLAIQVTAQDEGFRWEIVKGPG